jgi:MinD superfamily P-loop ATPase
VETISDSDYIVLVTEPTPFGLNDLKLMVGLVRELGTPFGVVINKAGLGNRDVYRYLQKEAIEIIGEIPFNRPFAERYSMGDLFGDTPEEVKGAMERVAGEIEKQMVYG